VGSRRKIQVTEGGMRGVKAGLPHLVDDFYGWFFLGVCLNGYFSFIFSLVFLLFGC